MTGEPAARPVGVLGREAELAEIERLFDDPTGPARAVVIDGEAGIGKSTLWSAGVELARAAGWTVLSARGTETETGLSFAGLTDLLDPVIDEVIDGLPEPQRIAVEVALIRRSPEGISVGSREIGVGTLAVLRQLTASRPVLLAVDDLPWLDTATLDAVRFALRRLHGAPVRVLVSRRTSSGIATDQQADPAVDPAAEFVALSEVVTLRLGPLDRPVVERLLIDRITQRLPGPLLRRLGEQSGGNPFWALELGATVAQWQSLGGDLPIPLPIPQSLALLVAQRLDRLSPAVREVLFVVSALDQPAIALARRALEPVIADADTVIDEAVTVGVVAESGGRLRPAHPLLGSAALDRLPPLARAAMHRRLAQVVTDPEQRARHVVLAASGEPDAEVADILDAGATAARSRGATLAAAELVDRAVGFTPPGDIAAAARRGVTAAELYLQVGDLDRARTRAEAVWRADDRNRHVLPVLIEATYWTRSNDVAEAIVAPLVVDPDLDVHLRAVACALAADVGDGAGTPRAILAQRALDLFDEVGEDADTASLSAALIYLALARLDAGEGIAFDLMDRVQQLQRATPYVVWSNRATVVLACWYKAIDDLDASRAALRQVIADGLDNGDDATLPTMYGHLALTEVWAGNYAAAAAAIAEATQRWAGDGAMPGALKGADGLLRVLTGDLAGARTMLADRLAEEGAGFLATDQYIYRHVLGLAALLEGDDEEALAQLGPAYASASESGKHEPGRRHRLEGDLGQALVNTGRLGEADSLAKQQLALGERTGRPTLIGVAKRIEGLVLAARGELADAAAALELAVAAHRRSPLPLELGRSLLALGRVRRRLTAKARARESIQAALDCFTALGAVPFVALAKAELDKGRRVSTGSLLTRAEQQVADLVATGLTNREVAARLCTSVRTVEGHLAAVYRKLGVRSRSELAAKLAREASN